jgi:hypothetical protein
MYRYVNPVSQCNFEFDETGQVHSLFGLAGTEHSFFTQVFK